MASTAKKATQLVDDTFFGMQKIVDCQVLVAIFSWMQKISGWAFGCRIYFWMVTPLPGYIIFSSPGGWSVGKF